MAASTQFLSLAPRALSLNHPNSSAAAPSLFTPSSFKPLPKLVLALSSFGSRVRPTSKFVRYVAFSSDLEEEGLEAEEPSFSADAKLFVGNLPFTVDSAALADLFVQGGMNVEQVEVIYDKATGRSRGFGFVVMSSVEDAKAAAQEFNGYELDGRELRVNSGPPPPKKDFGGSRGGREYGGSRGGGEYGGSRGREFGGSRGGDWDRPSSGRSSKIYVGNLSWDVNNQSLESLFSKHGNVTEARVVYDRESGRSRGFGFVTYSSPDEVNNAIDKLDGSNLDGRPIRVSAAEDRR